MLEVVPHQLAAHGSQRFLDGGDLDEDVRAITVLLDHLLQASHLALDAAQTLEVAVLDAGIDSHRLAFSHGIGLLQATRARRRRRLLTTTLTELNAMAALARMGESRMPKTG